MITKKAEILTFIKSKPRTYKEIVTKFGASGNTNTILWQLEYDKFIYKPARGIYEIVPSALKKSKTK